MKTTKKIALRIGKVLAAIIGCVLMPVLIWVALGAAIYQKAHQREARKELVPTLGQIRPPVLSRNNTGTDRMNGVLIENNGLKIQEVEKWSGG